MNYQQPIYLLLFSLLLQILEGETVPHKINFTAVIQMATEPDAQDLKNRARLTSLCPLTS